jgi:hypothetical protein
MALYEVYMCYVLEWAFIVAKSTLSCANGPI